MGRELCALGPGVGAADVGGHAGRLLGYPLAGVVAVLDGGTWLEVPVGTYCVTDPRIRDGGSLSITVDGLDPLAVARTGGYGASVIPVGGMTVSAALATLFAAVAPGFPVSIEPTTVTLPAVMDLWDRDPADDWRDIAAAAGMVVPDRSLGCHHRRTAADAGDGGR